MTPTAMITHVAQEMERFFMSDTTGHDWHHVQRVWKMAKNLAQHYPKANHLQIELAALLHDRYDRKLVPDTAIAKQEVQQLLTHLGLASPDIEAILYTIDAVSFKNGNNPIQPRSIEDKIVQDADRLDAIGAIGIARTFAYSGAHNRPIYLDEAPDDSVDTAIAHFYDKLLTIKDTLHTPEAQSIAQHRHQFMLDYLGQFYQEWRAQ